MATVSWFSAGHFREVSRTGFRLGGRLGGAVDDWLVGLAWGEKRSSADVSIGYTVANLASRYSYYDSNGCFTDCCRCRFSADYGAEFPQDVPLTSIYSKGDGVVRWEACVVPYARCVEVTGSHVGLAFNRKVYAEVARTLARDGG